MEKAVAVQENKDVSTEVKAWGAGENIGAQDLLVSKIYHQQALSKLVQDGLAAAGDWCDSLTGKIIAKRDTPLSLVVFDSFKKLIISIQKPGQTSFEYLSTEDVTAANAALPWNEETPEGLIRRQLQYNYFVLPVGMMNELPYVLSLTSTKTRTAKKLNMMFAKLSRMSMPSASYVFDFTSVKETGDKGSWFGAEVTQGRKATKEELDVAYEWYVKIRKSKVVISEDEDEIPF